MRSRYFIHFACVFVAAAASLFIETNVHAGVIAGASANEQSPVDMGPGPSYSESAEGGVLQSGVKKGNAEASVVSRHGAGLVIAYGASDFVDVTDHSSAGAIWSDDWRFSVTPARADLAGTSGTATARVRVGFYHDLENDGAQYEWSYGFNTGAVSVLSLSGHGDTTTGNTDDETGVFDIVIPIGFGGGSNFVSSSVSVTAGASRDFGSTTRDPASAYISAGTEWLGIVSVKDAAGNELVRAAESDASLDAFALADTTGDFIFHSVAAGSDSTDFFNPISVPEPAALALVSLAGMGLLRRARR